MRRRVLIVFVGLGTAAVALLSLRFAAKLGLLEPTATTQTLLAAALGFVGTVLANSVSRGSADGRASPALGSPASPDPFSTDLQPTDLRELVQVLIGSACHSHIDTARLEAMAASLGIRGRLLLRDVYYVSARRSLPFDPARALELAEQCKLLIRISDESVTHAAHEADDRSLLYLCARPLIQEYSDELRSEFEDFDVFGANIVDRCVVAPARRSLSASAPAR